MNGCVEDMIVVSFFLYITTYFLLIHSLPFHLTLTLCPPLSLPPSLPPSLPLSLPLLRGVLGEPGSSAFMFEQKAIIQLSTQQLSLDPLELAIEIGAEDVHTETDPENVVVVHLICEPNELNSVCAAVRERGLGVSSTSLEYLPKSFKSLTQEQFEKAEKLVELLSEQSDVVAVYSNHELS